MSKTNRILIKNWEELSKIPNESATHILVVDVKRCNGHLYAKNPKPIKKNLSYMRQIQHLNVYLSTHTFYGKNYKHSSKILRACGFNVDIDNWDKVKMKKTIIDKDENSMYDSVMISVELEPRNYKDVEEIARKRVKTIKEG